MRVNIHLKNTTQFILNNVKHMGIMKNICDGRIRRIMYFNDAEFGLLAYPIADIAEVSVEG